MGLIMYDAYDKLYTIKSAIPSRKAKDLGRVRRDLNITKAELAEILSISRSTLHRIEQTGGELDFQLSCAVNELRRISRD